MKSIRCARILGLVVVSVMLLTLVASCAAPAPQVVEKVVTQVVEKQVEIIATAAPQTTGFSSADKATEEAKKQCDGKEINIIWESGLQPQDPLTFGPMWQELTGMKINVVETAFTDMYTKQMQDHLSGGGSYDVLSYPPAWLVDFVNAGLLEPLNSYMDKYLNKDDLKDYLPTYGAEGYGRLGDTWYGFPDDGDVFITYYRKDLFEAFGSLISRVGSQNWPSVRYRS